MTSTMTQLVHKNAEHNRQKELLNRFITEHKVSVDLSNKLATYLKRERMRIESRPVLESQVPIFNTLPDGLKKELHAEVFTRVLVKHPVFNELDSRDTLNVEQVCHKAMQDVFFSIGETVWHHGTLAEKMFFVLRGTMHLYPVGSSLRLKPLARANGGDMLSEEALWLTWNYSDHMVSIADVAVFTLS